ncbi:MAG: M48 family metalloprotease [Acidobacteriota bacterium]
MNEDKAARYHRLRRRALMLGTATTVALLAGLVLTGVSLALQAWSTSVTSHLPLPLSSMGASALFALSLWGLHEPFALSLAHYLGYSLERRYGLSRQRLRHWVADQARASALSLLVSVVGVTFVYEVMRLWPAGWWLVVWLAGVLASIGLAWLAPVVVMPLFFRFTPLSDATLRQRLVDLSSRAGTPVLGAYEWRLSDRTRRGMAALIGLASTRRVIVSDTLVSDYSADEVEVVLAHELAHHVHRDAWKGLALDAALWGTALIVASQVLPVASRSLGLQGIGDLAGLPVLLLVGLVASVLALPLINAASRVHECRADDFALDLTGNPEAFMSAMRRLAAQNLAEESPSRLARAFFCTHPPPDERLARARAWRRRAEAQV